MSDKVILFGKNALTEGVADRPVTWIAPVVDRLRNFESICYDWNHERFWLNGHGEGHCEKCRMYWEDSNGGA